MKELYFHSMNKDSLKQFAISTLGIVVLGLSISLISWHFKLVTSGLPGYALILNYLTNFPLATGLFIANTIILVLALMFAGKTAGLKGVYGYTLLSVVISLSKSIFSLSQVSLDSLALNIFLCVLQGSLAAFAISFVVYNKFSFGSYSSLLPITDKYYPISPPKLFLILDFILSLITAYYFGLQTGIFLLINAGAFFITFHYTLKWLNRQSFS